MAKKKDYPPKEPGERFEEIDDAQRQTRRRRKRQQGSNGGKPKPIDSIEKSKQRDDEELRRLGQDSLEKLHKRKATEGEQ